ncbi:hypothetical protein SASPL_135908 [Salvia splendens]|uniref:Uncharacterized protein n=1 Tax=Salvia splendens TaxID=180675 RepID=A0A8X8WXA4_SALSN|nr:hypothetical protein SASPL_135908 [Salvia splendens]
MASVASEKKQKKRNKHSLSELKAMGQQLLTSRAHVNNLLLLLTYINPNSPTPQPQLLNSFTSRGFASSSIKIDQKSIKIGKATASVASEKKQKKRNKHSLSELIAMGQQLLTSRAHVNNLPLLLTIINPSSPPQYALESLLSLQSFFTPLIPMLSSSSSSHPDSDSNPDPEFIYLMWLRSKFNQN